jgi:superfamily II DNA or RNA helicase
MKLEEIAAGASLSGIEPAQIVTVVATVFHGEGALQLVYRMPDGAMKERLLGRADEASLSAATVERPFSFDGDAAAFQLTCEAKRIDLAFLFDPMMAVHTSNVDALPHQITAVYESMLPRQPLRFVLADDPGAGKTIMAGLYIRELIMRADARRILVVAPGSLVEQWRDELFEKFGLEFPVYSPLLEQASPSGNPFENHRQLIVRLDQLSRNEELQEKLCAAGWDLVVFDEAHKLAAHYFGTKLDKTARFRFAEKLGSHVRHLLLMTATPHNGKDEDFQLFLSLLDSDRFYGKFRDGVHKVDAASDLMRRMVKEELVRFDGTPLFPERKAYTVNYTLSQIEAALYEAVTRYVQTEMGKADQLQGPRKGSVGFALTALQRRLASSPEAIYQSLKRRKGRLETRLREEKLGVRGRTPLAETLADVPEDDDDLNAEEQETLEETLVDDATAARTVAELESEIRILEGLEQQAKAVVASGQDRKWDELSKILQNNPEMHDAAGRQRKIIIFSEHRDTLNYLHGKIAGVLGNSDSIITIHGGTHRDERRRLQALFRSDPEVRVLVATDAAGEGVNLQNANLMVNYDLPWNPNRLEQRFGRISEQAHPAFPVTIYYAFKQSERDVEKGIASTGWETFLDAVLRAGFTIDGTWPMRTEREGGVRNANRNSLASSIVLVCRMRPEKAATVSRREFLRELNAILPEALDEMTKGGGDDHSPVAPVDLSQAIIGPGIAVFSKYAAVLEADGTPMSVRTALRLINRFLAEDDFDPDTQFCLHWFEQNGWKDGKFGAADTLARAKGTSVDGVRQSGILRAAGGLVRLLKWADFPTDWDWANDTRLPVWEVLHQLIRIFKTEGESGAGAMLTAVEAKAEGARQLAYRLYTLCERAGWAEDARVYNELITSWAAIEAAAAKVPGPRQAELFDV